LPIKSSLKPAFTLKPLFFSRAFFYSCLLAYCLSFNGILAQDNDAHFPIRFDQFNQTYSWVNPAYIGNNEHLGVKLGNQFYGNSLGPVYTVFSTMHLQVNNAGNAAQANDHFMGLNLYRDQEGQFIGRTRAYLLYAIRIPLTEELSITGGVGAGGLNYTVAGTQVSRGNSVFVSDLKGGGWLNGENFYLGASVNQAFNNTFTPISQTISLSRYYNFAAGGTLTLSPEIDLNPNVQYLFSSDREPGLHLNLLTTIRNKLAGGLTYHHKRSFVPMLGIRNVGVGNGNFEAMVSYRIPIGRYVYTGLRTYELTVGYFFNRKQ